MLGILLGFARGVVLVAVCARCPCTAAAAKETAWCIGRLPRPFRGALSAAYALQRRQEEPQKSLCPKRSFPPRTQLPRVLLCFPSQFQFCRVSLTSHVRNPTFVFLVCMNSMISSILSMRGVTGNPPFFQVPGKIFNGNPGGGVVQISAVHDDQLRPMHFCICILDSPATGGVSAPASAAAVAATAAGVGSGGSGNGSCVRIRANVG